MPVSLPALEGKSIIQVALGDHHHLALTSKGEVFSWGVGSHGQLGLGDGRHRVEEPTKVTFPGDDAENETFVFGITAGGAHTGVLALGSKRSDKIREKSRVAKEDVSAKEREDDSEERGGTREMGEAEQGVMGGTTLGAPFFRVGFAGRGGQMGGAGVGLGRGGVSGQAGEGVQRSWFRGLRWNRGGGNGEGSGSGSGSGAGPST
jgi:SCF-associated factor 1